MIGDAPARRPDPFAKPAPRTAPEANSASGAPATPVASTSPTAADWGLTLTPRGNSSLKFKIAGVLGLLASLGGGYYGYQQYAARSAATQTQDEELLELADDETEKGGRTEESETLDPFDDDSLNLAGNNDLMTPKKREPRRMGHTPDAAPAARRDLSLATSRNRSRQTSIPIEDEILDLDNESDDSAPRISQVEPDLEDDDEFADPPPEPAISPRKSAASIRAAKSATTARQPGRHAASGPKLDALDGDFPADITDDFADTRMEGYGLPETRHPKKSTGHKLDRNHNHGRGPNISNVDSRIEEEFDDRLEGYTADEPTTRRAYSKTHVVRSIGADDDDETPPPAGIPGESLRDLSEGMGSTPIPRRGGHSPDSRNRAHRSSLDEFSEPGDSANEIYKVQPEDNFWKISRKLYGSARYYQALVRHNQDRVPDPQKLRPGTQISTPTVAVLERRYPDLIEKSAAGANRQPIQPRSSGGRTSFDRPNFDRATDRGFDGSDEPVATKAPAEGYFYSKSGAPMYRIGTEDTLTGIAQKYLGRASRWTDIYEQNQDILSSPDNLTLGTVIRLPSDASRLSLVPENTRRR